MKKRESVKEFYEDGMYISWICLNFVFSFTIYFFAPLEAFFANNAEFWFTFGHILPMLLVVFILHFILMSVFLFLLRKLRQSVWIYGFLFCTLLYLYVQGNYVPREYGAFDGTDIQWDSYHGYAIASIILICVFLMLWVVISIKIKDKIYDIGKWVCTGLVLIQLITLVILSIQNGIGKRGTTLVTTQDMFNLSKNRNIIVFILDCFDSSFMQELLNETGGNKYEVILEDFTYYPDAVGGYPNTRGSLPYILTGKKYQHGETYRDWVDNGYAHSDIYTAMKKCNYDVGLYTSPKYVSSGYAVNMENAEHNMINYFDFAKVMYKLVAFNYAPHQLKRFFSVETKEFEKIWASKEYDVYSSDTPLFYEMLNSEGLIFSDSSNSFKVYHVDGTHTPYTFDELLKSEFKEEYDACNEAEGCMHLLDQYIQILKENEEYDNTAIVVMADHGYEGLGQNPLFMIKNFDERKKFTISDVKMSWDYLDEIFVSLASGEKIDEYYIQKFANDSDGVRYFSNYERGNNEWDRKYMPEITDYLVYGDAKDISKFESVNEYQYRLGEVLLFRKSEKVKEYCVYGISPDGWTNGRYAIMQFDWADDDVDILVDLGYSVVSSPPQTVVVYANRHKIAEFVAEGADNQKIVIPHQMVSEGRLVLSFEFPDCISPKERGTGEDIRKLALFLDSIALYSMDKIVEENREKYSYELGSTLSFCKENATANKFCINGFSSNEESFTWTDGNEAEMEFSVSGEYQDLLLDFSYFTYADEQHIVIYVNDNKVEDYVAKGTETKQIAIPNEYIDNDRIVLRFELPDAVSPKDAGTGEDVRALALAMIDLTISSTE